MKGKHIFAIMFLLISVSITYAGPVGAADRYVGPCPGCYATISAAVADSVGGDRIYVYSGTYTESVDLDQMKTEGNITLIALGAVTIDDPADTAGIIFNAGHSFPGDITIEGFDVATATAGIYLDGISGKVVIKNCRINSAVTAGIYLDTIRENAELTGCKADDSGNVGIYLEAVGGNAIVKECTADRAGTAAIYMDTIGGNAEVRSCSADTAGSMGIYLTTVSGDVVVLNTGADDATTVGMYASTIGGSVTVTDLSADGNGNEGIHIETVAGQTSLADCNADGHGTVGIYMAGISGDLNLGDCRANRNGNVGIYAETIGGNVSIKNCNAKNSPYGIAVDGLNPDKLNTITCNNISGNSTCGLALMDGSFDLDATNNWWGHASGPTHASNPGGTGDMICESSFTGTVTYDPWLHGPFEITSPCNRLPIPTLGGWGLVALAALMAGGGAWIVKRRKRD